MKKIKIILAIALVVLFLCACNSKGVVDVNSEQSDNKTESSSSQQAPIENKIESVTPQSPTIEEIPKQSTQAVAPPQLNAGKTILVNNELKRAKYSSSISKLQSILDEYKYNISLAVYSVDGSKSMEYNTESGIFGACTVKAAYTLYACKQMENGNGSLDTQITYEQKHYEPGTGDMQYSPFGTVFTMETALHKSMSISDNVGYLMSVDFFGRDGYNAWVSELGCDSLAINPTVWSLKTRASDLVKIWCEIYNYFSTNTEGSIFLKNSCTNTAGNYATAALSGVEYSHKQGHNSTGDWLSLSDAGIVWKGDTPYIIAILTDAPGPSAYSSDVFAQIIDIVHNDLF